MRKKIFTLMTMSVFVFCFASCDNRKDYDFGDVVLINGKATVELNLPSLETERWMVVFDFDTIFEKNVNCDFEILNSGKSPVYIFYNGGAKIFIPPEKSDQFKFESFQQHRSSRFRIDLGSYDTQKIDLLVSIQCESLMDKTHKFTVRALRTAK